MAALSRICRYNGHLRRDVPIYTVAQHACLVSRWLEEDGYDVDVQYAGLHHDSGEAYTGDIVSQIKFSVPELRPFLARVEDAVDVALGVPDVPKELIKKYDLIALATEYRDLLTHNTSACTWGELPPPRAETIIPLGMEQAREAMLARHNTLVYRRK